jgi:ferritin-like metal-binding protein YciE
MMENKSSADGAESKSTNQDARQGAKKKKKGGARVSKTTKKKRGSAGREFDVMEAVRRELADVSDAETQLGKFTTKLAESTQREELRELCSDLVASSESYARAIARVVAEYRKGRGKQACEPMRAMVKEASRGMKSGKGSDDGELLAITGLQKMLHYTIASFGSLRAWGERIRDDDAVILFERLTEERKRADKAFTRVAEQSLWSRRGRDNGWNVPNAWPEERRLQTVGSGRSDNGITS